MALLHSMQALCKATALQLAVLVVLVPATEAGKPKLIVIGDSYSDIGNGVNNVVNADLSTDQLAAGPYPAPPYFQGRFSNGYIWVDDAAAALGLTVSGLAQGAAVTGAPGTADILAVYPPFDNLTAPVPISVATGLQQAQSFVQTCSGGLKATDSFVIFLSANDYVNTVIGQNNATVSGVVGAIKQILDILTAAGAKQLIVFNSPPLQGLPLFTPPNTPSSQSSTVQAAAASLASAHNTALHTMVASFNAANPGVTASIYDINSFFVDLISNAASYGFTTGQPCYMAQSFFPGLSEGYANQVCSNPAQHIFWDAVHLSKNANALLAASFVKTFPQLKAS